MYRCPSCTAFLRRRLGEDDYECTDCGARCDDPAAVVWMTREMLCAICSHEWSALYPKGATQLECPACSYLNAITAEHWKGSGGE